MLVCFREPLLLANTANVINSLLKTRSLVKEGRSQKYVQQSFKRADASPPKAFACLGL